MTGPTYSGVRYENGQLIFSMSESRLAMNRNHAAWIRPRTAPPESLPPESLADRRLVAPPTSVPSAERRDYDHSHHPTLRVGFLTPNLLMGGVEHWLLGLLKNNPGQLNWSVAVTKSWAIEPEMRCEAEAFAEVVTGEPVIAALVASADLIVAWGVYGLTELLQGFAGPVWRCRTAAELGPNIVWRRIARSRRTLSPSLAPPRRRSVTTG